MCTSTASEWVSELVSLPVQFRINSLSSSIALVYMVTGSLDNIQQSKWVQYCHVSLSLSCISSIRSKYSATENLIFYPLLFFSVSSILSCGWKRPPAKGLVFIQRADWREDEYMLLSDWGVRFLDKSSAISFEDIGRSFSFFTVTKWGGPRFISHN